jgi:HEPN domain-containing protein
MPSRARDWLNQAMRDLEQAQDSQKSERHEWACFAAQQAGAKSAKALQLYSGQRAKIYAIIDIFKELPDTIKVPTGMIEKARVLDNFYIPARYPNSHPQGAPFEHYGPLQSEAALTYAREIIDFAIKKVFPNPGP